MYCIIIPKLDYKHFEKYMEDHLIQIRPFFYDIRKHKHLQDIEVLYPENITGTVSNIFVYERNTTYFKVPTIEIDPPVGGGNAAIATAKLYGNALLESVTISNGGGGYSAKPNVAVITGNIVVARIDRIEEVHSANSDFFDDPSLSR